MIYDMAAFTGHYERRPIGVGPHALARQLAPWGISHVFTSRLDRLRMENSHAADLPQKPQVTNSVEVQTVPLIDPTLPTWPEQAQKHHAANGLKLPLLRLHPNYHGYKLTDTNLIGPLVEWAHFRGVVIQVVVNVDDARRQHPLGQVPDVSFADILALCKSFPHQPFLVSGPVFGALHAISKNRPANLWADTARIETGDGLAILTSEGWLEHLVFATHAPILIPHSAIARILADLPDAKAAKIFWENAKRLLNLP